MPTQGRPQLAKLTRPRLHKAVARERLFALLDEAREHKPAICVVGPPGAGKTTLVASWLDARNNKGIWFQVDPGDADLATFFYYLAEAARPFTRKGQRSLPLLTPEYIADVEGFSRRFFRDLFSRLPAGSILVLDNYQEVAPEQTFHHLIAQAVEEVPQGLTLIVISRRDPPDCYARLVANKNVALVDWDALKVTRSEARAIADLQRNVGDEILDSLHSSTEGWVAGLVLGLERATDDMVEGDVKFATRQATFDYFASQILSRVPDETRNLLFQTAYLPEVPAQLARSLSGNPRAGAILDDLYRRHLFVHRKPTSDPTYWYHALFQSFLQSESVTQCGANKIRVIQRRSAALLAHHGATAAAIDLYLDMEAWGEAEQLIIARAAEFIAQGRWKVVADWIGKLPAAVVDRSEWLLYWAGIASMAGAPTNARTFLQRSFALSMQTSNWDCRVQAVAGVIQTYLLEYNQFRPMDPWIKELQDAMSHVTFSTADSEIRVRSSLLTALFFRKPDDADLDTCAARVLELLPVIEDANLRLSSVTVVLACASLSGPIELGERALPIASALWKDPQISGLNAALAGYILAWYFCLVGNRGECLRAIQTLQEIAEREELPVANSYAATIGAWLELDAGNASTAAKWVELLDRTKDSRRLFDQASCDAVKGWLAIYQGDPVAAEHFNTRAVESFDAIGSVFHQTTFRAHGVWIGFLRGGAEAARQRAAQVRQIGQPLRCVWIEIFLRMVEARIALESGDYSEARDRLRAALQLGRSSSHDHAYGKNAQSWMPRLCALALESSIETDYVNRIIKRFGWSPPPGLPRDWPWRVRIYALGGFRIEVNGQVLNFAHKTPKKPLALLKALIAFGSRRVPQRKLMDAVWPEDDGDAAYHNLGVNLHRLRTLLGHPQSVELADGLVSLNGEQVWTDVECFEHVATELKRSHASLTVLLEVYRGDFLADVDDSPWALPKRDALRRAFVRTVAEQASALERDGKQLEALQLYIRGLEADSVAQELYHGLIRCHATLGDLVEARHAYLQMARALESHLGVSPPDSTLALMKRLDLPTTL